MSNLYPSNEIKSVTVVGEIQSTVSDSPQIDAFSRNRVSNPYTLFVHKQINNSGSLFFDEEINGNATSSYNYSSSLIDMVVSGSGSYIVRQSYMRFNYQPGKSQLIFLTGVLGEPVSNTEARIGYFNSDATSPYTSSRDGIYFGRDGTDNYICVTHLGVENKINQSQWNLDKMDGTGTSGIQLDFNKAQIFVIDFEWLGVGRVRTGFVINGLIYYAHEFNHANNVEKPYMKTPNHSVRYEIYSSGGSSFIKQICCSVQSEGGKEPSGVVRSVSTNLIPQSVADTPEAILGIRLRDNNIGSIVIPESLSVLVTSTANFKYDLLFNPVYAETPTWNPISEDSCVEVASGSGTNTISNVGQVITSGYGTSDINNISLPVNVITHLGTSISGSKDEFWLSVTSLSAQSEDFYGSLIFREIC